MFKANVKFLRKSFLKKVIKKFGGLKNLPYLCTTFRFEKAGCEKRDSNTH